MHCQNLGSRYTWPALLYGRDFVVCWPLLFCLGFYPNFTRGMAWSIKLCWGAWSISIKLQRKEKAFQPAFPGSPQTVMQNVLISPPLRQSLLNLSPPPPLPTQGYPSKCMSQKLPTPLRPRDAAQHVPLASSCLWGVLSMGAHTGVAPVMGQGKPGKAQGDRCPSARRCRIRDLQPRPCIPMLLQPLPKTLLLRLGLPSSPHVCTHASIPAPPQCAGTDPAAGTVLLWGCCGDCFHLRVLPCPGAAQHAAGCPCAPDSSALGCATLTPLPFLHLLYYTSRWFLLIPVFL